MKILIHSDDPRAPTGYGIQAKKMGCMFQDLGHQVIYSAQFSLDAQVYTLDIDNRLFKIYGMGKGKFIDVANLVAIYDKEKFDLIITMADWQMIEKMVEAPPEIFCRWICYCAADAQMLTTRWDYLIQEIPYMVFFTPKFGESVVQQRRLGYVNYCPLTVDPNVFKPLPDRDNLRLETKRRMNWRDDCITILTVARNQWRKNYPEIVVAAKQLERIHKGIYRFVFHCRPQEDFGWDLPRLIDHYGMRDVIAISDQAVNDEQLNHIYNTADYFLLPSQGEGFGIPLVEAAMCEMPVITTGSTASLDIARMIGWEHLCLSFDTYWQNGPTIPRPYVRSADIFDGVTRVAMINQDHTKRGREMAIDEFAPEVAARKWREILEEAEKIVNMRIGKSGPYLGGTMTVNYEFPRAES